MTVEKLPMTRSEECRTSCVLFDIGLPRCTALCQQLRWDLLDAKQADD